ncbi:cytochrome c oxidase subunit IVB [Bacillus mycoides]|jgi:cytochrome c oxidase subunit 4|uniref:Cytochrome c oxidase subunit IVB n=11 Tax=Bacillus cereus group TaxID=86661 RepID=A0A150C8D1_BACCE|nr:MULTISPECIES: cytochrome c oxidase subunit IVB [Bacillus]EEL04821.1 Cytochrome c oxidase, subunit IV [Bacillus cereus BDRD-ST196]EJQ68215.1 cytochrome c oxidase, subunit IVB [Bacillus cereus HuA2-4]EJS04242.1 cytochrome c oxidase, subunit IVB [Bacillus cereus VDM034]EJS15190.1 cytochrome c oxidase, subunit IVB [Bacillus cereus VDM062]MBK5514723.1 cytochrome c oxidase subunit IVB [Bacillus sp. TH11]RAN89398.1 cytochrome c oxidase subunit IVB [Bacillus sp. SRB_28]
MAVKQTNNPKVDLVYRKRKSAEEMKHQVVTFSLMIFLTLVAFAAVAYPKTFSPIFSVPFILLLAVIQVIFQLYYFMHMSHKGHEAASFFLYSGLLIGLLTILAFMTIVWI